jgi:hypothetical protein
MPPHSNLESSCIEWRNPHSAANESSSSFDVIDLVPHSAANESSSSFDVIDLPSSSTLLPPLTDPNDTWNDEAKKTKKSVRFNPVVRCKKIPHINDISRKQKGRIWIGGDDLRAIRRRCRDIVDRIEAGIGLDSDASADCLEHWLREQQYKRRFFRTQACREVLHMQQLQIDLFHLYSEHGDISKLIAIRYSNCAAEAQIEAQIRALEDAFAIGRFR